ncbi:SphA family protein [Acidocella aminolytica]|uniref:MetA pathway phenol degradation-like protein n=1 Tax=Acidocella aminolytica 101 = DSM 11237 TaxID=1120923 RepID=A0A0D6PI91_9PROT|nr:transporter [Acidocella aminolytica]GAN80544.1 metA pathway phenol degradation-like protein [Acidocella aminolytica 101 = DSM 11237]GBQ43025.1 meta-pathway phenol degradation-like protein [Acidocella aminolytica 101 = DSM 11237]SHE29242.1 Uncharacterized conserved protein [Acidocella aminolytica 101 = DSM 11237]
MKKTLPLIISLTMLPALPAFATEGGTQEYPIGVGTVANGNFPLPGMLQYFNYTELQESPEYNNGSGHSAVPRFHLMVLANASRFLYTWKPAIGPFHIVSGLVIPVANLDLRADGLHGHDFGVGDLGFQNYFGYANASHSIFMHFGLDLYAPTGDYNKNALINTGLNYWTFAPNYDFTFNIEKNLELTGGIITEFKTTNSSTHYHSGDDVDFDYGLSYKAWPSAPHFSIGLQGYAYKQFTNDTGPTAPADGNRGQEFGIGPQIRYDIPFGAIVLKYQHEFAVRNRPGGDKVWFEFAVPLFGGIRPST